MDLRPTDAAKAPSTGTPAGRAYPFPPYPYRLTKGLTVWLAFKACAFALFAMGNVLGGVLAFFVWDPWLLWNILGPASRGFGPVASRFRTKEREVWLTIDDGPDPVTTPRILELLDAHSAKATFFTIGDQVNRHPALAAEIVRRGHQLANHSASHPCGSFWSAGPARLGREIDRCTDAIIQAGAPAPEFFRAPVGIKTPFLHPQLAKRGMLLLAWSARGYDSLLSTDLAVRRIVAGIEPGAIVLLHDGRNDIGRAAVVERVLDHLARTGFRAVIPPRDSLCV